MRRLHIGVTFGSLSVNNETMLKCYQRNVTIDNLGDQFYDSTIIFGTLDFKKFGCSLMRKCSPL
jgi:hypothetical protein